VQTLRDAVEQLRLDGKKKSEELAEVRALLERIASVSAEIAEEEAKPRARGRRRPS